MIGICGDNCHCCPRYFATRNGGAKELEAVKELWVRLGLRDSNFPSQEMACMGCGPENTCAYPEVRNCAHGKGIKNCGLCSTYPCKQIEVVFEKSEALHSRAERLCTGNELDTLRRAFFSKRQNLVSDDSGSHRSGTDKGVKLLIIDGDFLQSKTK